MRIALIAPPFIPVPPKRYGGTELFVAHLAAGLQRRGHDVVVYANGESSADCEVRWTYPTSEWPVATELDGNIKDLNHTAWAVRDASDAADVIHLNSALGVVFTRFIDTPALCTLHHPHEPPLSDLYLRHADLQYVCISDFQRKLEPMPRITTVHHGIDLDSYTYVERKGQYLSFLGRMAPVKGPHLAIEAARRAGIPLKLAGEVQPMYKDYFDTYVRPHLDGRFIEFLGEADHAMKNDLLANSIALLFPIQWHEPFGLVMIEAMACGTPVVALEGGSVREIVRQGVSGWICGSVEEMADCVRRDAIPPSSCREHVARFFTLDRMVSRYEALYLGEHERALRRQARGPLHAFPSGSPLQPTGSDSRLA